jgi:predicted transcriptional regulator
MGETLNGKPVTDAQIDAWVAEAEVGYDVAELKKRGRGRPGRGAAPSEVIAVRLTAEELAALDAAAERSHATRSETIRAALAQHVA